MEKNLLMLGESNARGNQDIYGYDQKDNMYHNCFFELYQDTNFGKIGYVIKRPGVSSTVSAQPSDAVANSCYGVGCFTAQDFSNYNIYFAVFYTGDLKYHFYHFNPVTTVVTKIGSSSSYYSLDTIYRVKFTNIGLPDDSINMAMVFNDGITYVKGASIILQASPALGAPWSVGNKLTSAIYLNNRVFVGDTYTGQIWQSSLGGYATFSASEFISVESYGGRLVELGRYNNYIVAFKEYSTEFFEDVGNENGSVLTRVGSAVQQLGCTHPSTVVDTGGGELIWLATDEQQKHKVVKLNNSFNVEEIQDQALDKYLNLVATYDKSYAYLLNTNGHQFYVLTLCQKLLGTPSSTDLTNVTFVYDLKTKLWTQWYTHGVGTIPVVGGAQRRTLGSFRYSSSCTNTFNTNYVQSIDNGKLYQIDDFYGADFNGPINFSVQISNLTFGTMKRKFLNSVTIVTDISTYNTASESIRLEFSNKDEYVTFSRYLNANRDSFNEFVARAFGQFRRGTLRLTYQGTLPMRITAINVDFDIGEGYAIS